MSTILDALRKVEEEKRAQEADVRARLLSNSTRFDFRRPRPSRFVWGIVSGLVTAGVALGATWMLWPSPETASVTEVSPPPVPAAQVATTPPLASPEPRQRRQESPAPQAPTAPPPVAQITPEAAAVIPMEKPLLAVPPSTAQVSPAGPAPDGANLRPQYGPGGGGNLQNVTGSEPHRQGTEALYRSSDVVQRSPFVSSSPYDRTVAPPPPPPTERRAIAAAKPSPRPSPPAAEKSGLTTPPRASVTPNESLRKTPAPTPTRDEPLGAPPGASLSFLQWSADPDKRVVSIKVGTGPAMLAHEGDSVEGLTVVKIRPDAVELRSGESRYLLKAR
jgi:hypothetical protein